ncbi:MAG: nicotinamide riboside transporter PnuC [Microbacterium sp.]|jgi:nicotinamide mononucleotide transporter|nr:nicotinamide riboside transporter PnuC [Microbacterium sp.]
MLDWLASSWAEILGFATGLACVILAGRRNVWTYPIGIANNIVFVALFASSGIYASAGLQVVFLAFGVHGWWRWTRRVEQDADYVGTTPRRAVVPLIAAGIAGVALLWWILATFTDSQVAVADAATTSASLVAQYMLNRKWIQNWFVWIAVDVVFAVLALSQGLWITALLYVVFIAVCAISWRSWRRVRGMGETAARSTATAVTATPGSTRAGARP